MTTIKELSIEEKAKRYDEAKEKARKLKDEYNDIEGYYPNQWLCEELFPELKEESEESENERIRKDIVFYIAANHKDDGEKARWLYWLEKQGEKGTIGNEKEIPFSEKKPAWSEEDESMLNDIMHNIHFAETHRNVTGSSAMEKEQVNWLKSIKERVGCEADCTTAKEWSEDDDSKLKEVLYFIEYINRTNVTFQQRNLTHLINWLKSFKGRVQPKQEWSEEDERNLDWLITVCERIHYKSDPQVAPEGALILKGWLKSIKDRVQPQPKQEWSEEDENYLNALIGKMETLYFKNDSFSIGGYRVDIVVNWLKSLRPKNTWKPSKEQIVALRWVLNNIPYNKHKEEISGLLDQIKGL